MVGERGEDAGLLSGDRPGLAVRGHGLDGK